MQYAGLRLEGESTVKIQDRSYFLFVIIVA